MALYELDYDEGIVLQSTTASLGGTTEEEFENEELIELIVTNKRIIYIVEISTGFFSKAKTDVRSIPLSSIKVFNGVPQIKQVKHDLWGHSVQVQFLHGVEYWTLEKKVIPQWVSEITRLLVGETVPAAQVPIQAEETTVPVKEKKASVFGAFAGITSALKNVASTTFQTTPQVSENAPQTASVREAPFGQADEQIAMPNVSAEAVNRFCSNCGSKLGDGAKFCQGCGAPINGTTIAPAIPEVPKAESVPVAQIHKEDRQQKYVGMVLKCPHCGGVIGETTAICPDCGMRITGRMAVNSVQEFKEQLMEIEAGRKKSVLGLLNVYAAADPVDKKKLTLIQNFPIPNTVDDILEFMMLAIANIDVSASKKTWANSSQSMQVLAIEMPKAISDAWVAKMQQAYQKAEILFPNDPAFRGIQKLYADKMKELKIKI